MLTASQVLGVALLLWVGALAYICYFRPRWRKPMVTITIAAPGPRSARRKVS